MRLSEELELPVNKPEEETPEFQDVYQRDFLNQLLEDDELSFEEAAFMMGYTDDS